MRARTQEEKEYSSYDSADCRPGRGIQRPVDRTTTGRIRPEVVED